jgi:hypothetical protein
MGVVEPRSAGQSQDAHSVLDLDAAKIDGTRTQESLGNAKSLATYKANQYEPPKLPCSSIGKLASALIEYCPKEDTVLQTDVDEQSRMHLVNAGVHNLGNGNGGRRCRKGLFGGKSISAKMKRNALTSVHTWILIVSIQLLGSSEMMRTVESSHPTACCQKKVSPAAPHPQNVEINSRGSVS